MSALSLGAMLAIGALAQPAPAPATGLAAASNASAPSPAPARAPASAASDTLGPFNVTALEGGIGLEQPVSPDSALLRPDAPWSITAWVCPARTQAGTAIIVALGAPEAGGAWRGLFLRDGVPGLALAGAVLSAPGPALAPGRFSALAATYDGTTARLYVDGALRASTPFATGAAAPALAPRLALAPALAQSPSPFSHFGGSIAALRVSTQTLAAASIAALAATPPDVELVSFQALGVGWPLQEHAWRGLQVPQDPWTLPRGRAPVSPPHARPAPPSSTTPRPGHPGWWAIESWRLRPAPQVAASPAALARAGFADADWDPAEVPGTVLTTLIARGRYPDPTFGLNNLAIPESLSRQDYWYRSEFRVPPGARGQALTLIFNGVNYAAEVWLNGARLGTIRGAFRRGEFDIGPQLVPGGLNALAVRVSPPPHPGIPHEQSIRAGPGENGGMLALDGPTFIATEGWDWIPGIRDRDTGLWQSIELHASEALRLHDPQVVTHLPLPRTDRADLTLSVEVENRAPSARQATLTARLAPALEIRKRLRLAPGITPVTLDPTEFQALRLERPRLWWPNGYGDPELYTLELELEEHGRVSDRARVRFGVREVTYELSLFDHEGRLERVRVDPAAAPGTALVDVRHAALKRTPTGWAASLTPAGEHSAAVQPGTHASLAPHLVLEVNGVPIAARGGSWGMDDALKRVSRERLEPYFRLHRAAHLNIIRNWLGQSTEELFYDLADEYGLLVLNDFWESTQDFQLEAEDPALFLDNAGDVIRRYRNHPSIALWIGRNEGVPQPILNEGLADLVRRLDGTRLYHPSSNAVNLQQSGPYDYRAPEDYFMDLRRGFAVEIGTPSLATLESLRASMPAADLWPIGDAYAYHDWHFGGNGDVRGFMRTLEEELGTPADLEDFERKAQLLSYEAYRAIFEGFAAHLWSRNSGRLLWMTHPAWPSNTWQIYTADYDTAAPYYAVQKACEPLHAQLDLPDHRLTVVNTTRTTHTALTLRTEVLSLAGRTLAERTDRLDAPANEATSLAAPLDLAAPLAREELVLVRLRLLDAGGAALSENLYWQGRSRKSLRVLSALAPVRLAATARSTGIPGQVSVRLENTGPTVALLVKLTALDAAGARVLPVSYADNDVTLLPGEARTIEISCPPAGAACARIGMRGFDVLPGEVAVATQPSVAAPTAAAPSAAAAPSTAAVSPAPATAPP